MVATHRVHGLRLGYNASWRVNSFFFKNEFFYVHIFNSLSFFPKSVLRLGRPTSKKKRIFYSRRAWNRYIYRRMFRYRMGTYREKIFYYPLRFFVLPKSHFGKNLRSFSLTNFVKGQNGVIFKNLSFFLNPFRFYKKKIRIKKKKHYLKINLCLKNYQY
jgi:hypothetical protein